MLAFGSLVIVGLIYAYHGWPDFQLEGRKVPFRAYFCCNFAHISAVPVRALAPARHCPKEPTPN